MGVDVVCKHVVGNYIWEIHKLTINNHSEFHKVT